VKLPEPTGEPDGPALEAGVDVVRMPAVEVAAVLRAGVV
jgi:hypothetical protein